MKQTNTPETKVSAINLQTFSREATMALADKINEITRELETSMWAYHMRLTGSYDGRHEQIEHAKAVGTFAQAMEHLQKANSLMREHPLAKLG